MLKGKFIGILPQKGIAEFFTDSKEYIYLEIAKEDMQCVMHCLFIPVEIVIEDKKFKRFL